MTDDTGKLQGKTAVVTGGGRGIGRAIALAYAREGADVCVTARSVDEIQSVAEQIQGIGRNGLALPCDVTDYGAVDAMMQTAAEQLGRIDILVNNAGGGLERKPVGGDDPDLWRAVIDVNLMGTYNCSRAALPFLRNSSGGKIINVGSGMGHQPRASNSSYNSAKAAVWMFTRCLAMEVWRDNIAVNELIPGPVYTELTADIFAPDQPHPAIDSEWVKSPQDVVPMAMFLATQPPHGPTGQSFSIARRPI